MNPGWIIAFLDTPVPTTSVAHLRVLPLLLSGIKAEFVPGYPSMLGEAPLSKCPARAIATKRE
jgi:hypothetical protein